MLCLLRWSGGVGGGYVALGLWLLAWTPFGGVGGGYVALGLWLWAWAPFYGTELISIVGMCLKKGVQAAETKRTGAQNKASR